MEKTFELAPQTRKATFLPPSVNADKRTIDLTFSTGAAVRRFDWQSYEIVNEELSLEKDAIRMDRLNSGAPFLNSHNMYDLEDVLGVVERAWLDGDAKATVRIHDDSTDKEPVCDPIWRKIVAGIIRNVSVGYIVHQYRDVTKKGDALRTLLAIDWEPMEISAVAAGADPGAGFRAQPAKVSCRVISPDEPVIAPATASIAEPAFDIRNLRMVDSAGRDVPIEVLTEFLRSQQAAQQIPAEVVYQPDSQAVRARLELARVA